MFTRKLSSTLVRALSGVALGMLMLIPATLAGAPAASASTGSSTLFGASISSPSNLAMKRSQFGRLPIVRVYLPGLPSTNAWSTGLAGANRSAIVISFKALPEDIILGYDNGALANFFDTAPRNVPVYYSYWHEPEDNIAAGQFTLADYLKAWADVVRIADAAHNTELHSTLVLMGWDVLPHSGRNWRSYFPPGNIISTISWDSYPVDGVGTPSPASFMAADVAVSRAAHLRFGFSEFNTTTVPGRPNWLSAVGAYIRASGAAYGTLYDSADMGGIGGRGTFVITDGASENAWASVMGNAARHDNGGPQSPPTLVPNQNSLGVAIVQYGLKWLGFYPRTGAVNGHYGPVTDASIRAFQRKYNCQPPHNQAHFGPGSWDALTSARGSATSMPTLVWHESSLGVVIVQYGLQRLGYYPSSGVINGHYGSVTDRAIRAFQKVYNSVPAYNASRFGPGSWAALTNAHTG